MLQLNTRRLVNYERRTKLANAILSENFNFICLSETWLNENICTLELLLQDYDIYQADRPLDGNKKNVWGSLTAVQNCLHAEKYAKVLPESCVAVKLKFDDSEMTVCAFHNSPAKIIYRYNSETFTQLFNLFPKNTLFYNMW